jgi:hypothetical protein
MEGAYFKGMNHHMVETHVRKLIQEAVEDGVGELDLRYFSCPPPFESAAAPIFPKVY